MVRSFSNRMLGGVCGGLEQSLRLPAGVWRILFLLSAPLTLGTTALLYLLLWWLLPLESPLEERSSALRTVFALFFSALMLGAFFARDALAVQFGADLFIPLILLLPALVFAYRQLRSAGQARRDLILGLLVLLLALLPLLQNFELLPGGLQDVLQRALPALLVFIGLATLLRERISLGSAFALIVSVALAGGIAAYAYQTRASQQRSENQFNIAEEISPAITTLQVNLGVLDTTIEVFAAPPGSRTIRAAFNGSPESFVNYEYNEYSDGSGLATFTLMETRPNPFPRLEGIGRSSLRVELPPGIALALAYAGRSGTASLDMKELSLERLKLDQEQGDVLFTLPPYQPLSPSVAQDPGALVLLRGNLRLLVPPDLGARFVLAKGNNQRPLYDDLRYALEDQLNEWILVTRDYARQPYQVLYNLSVPGGTIRLDVQTP